MGHFPLVRFVHRIVQHSRVAQIVVLVGVWGLGDLATHVLNLPVPGAIVGLALMLLLLGTGLLRPSSVQGGARLLIGEMLLFFVPAVLAVLDHVDWLGSLGMKLFATVLLGTLFVMLGTALAVDLSYRWWVRHAVR
ncbi:MAG: CidA/LrgA family protein [Rhodospirillaceae bacterium]|nr:CidA/LrgA family protein [Rhodospirillaceae bacterium]